MRGHKPMLMPHRCGLGIFNPHGIDKRLCMLVSSCPHRESVAERQPNLLALLWA